MIKTRLRIRTYGDPVLRQPAKPVKEVGPAEKMLINAMIATIADNENEIGLAAPQVGVSKQIFIIDVGQGPQVFVNPRISHPKGKEQMQEGCLSFPGLSFTITRPKRISVDYVDQYNQPQHLDCEGFLARVILHEYDHLHAKMIIDYANEQEKQNQKQIIDSLVEQTKRDLENTSN